MTAVYLDSSAAVKLYFHETESGVLRQWLGQSNSDLVSSSLLIPELMRATSQWGPDALALARWVISRIDLVAVDASVLERAGELAPQSMRTLDAIHLATALDQVQFVTTIITYDHRLAAACYEHGMPVVSPGAKA